MRYFFEKAGAVLLAALLLCPARVSFAEDQNSVGVNRMDAVKREFQQENFDAALAALNEADKGAEPSGRSVDLRGCIYLEQQKFDEALKAFPTATERDPTSLGLLHIGDVYARQHQWEAARDAYQTAAKATNILMINERLRFGIFMSHLGEKDQQAAQQALDRLPFPTESAAYYYGQAAWAYAHGTKRDGEQWVRKADAIFPSRSTAWFRRFLFDFGWIKKKPEAVFE